MSDSKCLRCKRKITAILSIERKYGAHCYAIIMKAKQIIKPIVSLPKTLIDLIYSIKQSIRPFITTKTYELLTALRVTKNFDKILQKIEGKHEMIDRVLIPLIRIQNPIRNNNTIIF